MRRTSLRALVFVVLGILVTGTGSTVRSAESATTPKPTPIMPKTPAARAAPNQNDVLGWRETRWGMTEEQVAAVLKGENLTMVDGWVPRYIVLSDTFKVHLEMVEHGLAKVTLVPSIPSAGRNRYRFGPLEAALTKKYGMPANKTIEGVGGMLTKRRVWAFHTTSITLELTEFYVGKALYDVFLALIYEPTAGGDAGKL